MSPTTAITLMPAALERFGERVHAVPAAGWDAPTPCTDWTVRDLVNHVTGEQLWAPHLLRGETMEQVGDRYDGDVLGAEPTAAWDTAAAAARTAWENVAGDGHEGLRVHTSMGQIPVEDYAEQMHIDLVVHGWDLAKGAGLLADVPGDHARHALTYVEPRAELFSGSGVFGPPMRLDTDDPAERLLALLGRDPR